jgi:formyltetrahydrofolate-dependent phosphoribosylglycinamide formyltransferase
MRVAVLASGGGTNLQALLDTCRGNAPARVALVASNRADAGALKRAQDAGVGTYVIPDHTDGPAIVELLRAHDIELVVLAGYLKLVPEQVVNEFAGRILNIHPALLPSFGGAGMYGMRVHRAVLESGSTVSGPTVHIVTAEYDKGPIVAQWPVPVADDDTPDTLQRRVLAVEHQLLPAVVMAAARAGEVTRIPPTGQGFMSTDDAAAIGPSLSDPSTSDQSEEE